MRETTLLSIGIWALCVAAAVYITARAPGLKLVDEIVIGLAYGMAMALAERRGTAKRREGIVESLDEKDE